MYSGCDRDRKDWRDGGAASGAFPNVILSPYMAFYTEQAVSDMVRKTVEAMVLLSEGKESLLEVRH